MNDEHSSKKRHGSLDQRLAKDPQLLEKFHQIADLREQLIAQGLSMDEVESRVMGKIRALGKELLGGIAQEKSEASTAEVLRKNPSAIKHRKKK
jgi:hypothetical protein